MTSAEVPPIPEEFLRKISFVKLKEELPCSVEVGSKAADEEKRERPEFAVLGGGSRGGHQRQPMKKKDRRRQRHEQWLQS